MISSFSKKAAQCACKNKQVFECLIVVAPRGNKNDVTTFVCTSFLLKFYSQIKFPLESCEEFVFYIRLSSFNESTCL